MSMTHFTNNPQNIEVNSFYFTHGKRFKSFPERITLDHDQYTFKSGLEMLVQRGQDVVRLFQMTDGQRTFRLRQENDQWTLVGLGPVVH
jgi:hypothetical protein